MRLRRSRRFDAPRRARSQVAPVVRAMAAIALAAPLTACDIFLADLVDDLVDDTIVEPEPGDYGTPFIYGVDPSVRPFRHRALRPGGEEADLAAVRAPNGDVSSFAVGELVLTGDGAGLDEAVERVGGTVIASTDPAEVCSPPTISTTGMRWTGRIGCTSTHRSGRWVTRWISVIRSPEALLARIAFSGAKASISSKTFFLIE